MCESGLGILFINSLYNIFDKKLVGLLVFGIIERSGVFSSWIFGKPYGLAKLV